jgi:hypothetical protein
MPFRLLKLRSLHPSIAIIGLRRFVLCPSFDFGQTTSRLMYQYIALSLGLARGFFIARPMGHFYVHRLGNIFTMHEPDMSSLHSGSARWSLGREKSV